jgi:hypothetical protein
MAEMTGKDGKQHRATMEASSVFHVAEKATQSWAKFWFYDPDLPVVVYAGKERYLVRQESLRGWRAKRTPRRKVDPMAIFLKTKNLAERLLIQCQDLSVLRTCKHHRPIRFATVNLLPTQNMIISAWAHGNYCRHECYKINRHVFSAVSASCLSLNRAGLSNEKRQLKG